MSGETSECSDEERWKIPDTWALKLKGRKRAIKVYKSEAEAHQNMDSEEHFVEHREGKANKCENYCPCRDFCPQYEAETK